MPAIRHHRRLGLALAGAALLGASVAEAQQRFELSGGEWQAVEAPASDSPEGQIVAMRKALAEGHPDRAIKLADAWIRRYPNHPQIVQAYLLRGDAKSAKRRYYRALFDYEYIIRAYPASPEYQVALEREYEIARLYTNGVNRHFLGMPILPAEGEGEELFIRIQERAPGSEIGEKASLALSDYYFLDGNMQLAAEAYDLFLQNYPTSQHREWAMLRLIQASLARFKGPAFDGTGLVEASQRLKMYRNEYPAAAERMGADALLVRIDESLALKDLVTAGWYERRNQPVSAAYTYRRIVQDYPQTAAAQRAIERIEALNVPVAVTALPAPAGSLDPSLEDEEATP